ncbi:hypothetical protein [Sphingomonas sp.]|uniref:hypothetical protein n=1 Tax=Sphingomonas sp. TaxID=28214 RepID=UPI0035C79B70
MSSVPESQARPSDALSTRLARALAQDAFRIEAAIADFFLGEDDRLDDRVRVRMATLLAGAVEGIEQAILAYAARQTGTAPPGGVHDRLVESGLLRDHDLGEHLIGVARLDVMAAALAVGVPQSERSDLLVRLCSVRDGVVASAASALLAAINRARSDGADALPAAVHARLAWWVAAALHERSPEGARALVEGATRSLAAHDEATTVRALAHRLVVAIDARPEELGGLLIEALADARPVLFVAALTHAARLAPADALMIALDPSGDRLWVVLRALGLDRATIARIGLLLCEGDPRRDVEAFAEQLDTIMGIDPDAAEAAMSSLRLPPEFRSAQRNLARSAQS